MTPEQLTGKTESALTPVMVGRKAFLIHPQVEADLLRLKHAAELAGFDFHLASGFRSFTQQLAIWNAKFSGKRPVLDKHSRPLDATQLSDEEKLFAILRWSALPGASRHHWGTDFDVYDRAGLPDNTTLRLEPWEYLTGHQQAFYQWLTAHLHDYGFFFPYRSDLGGIAIEPWHISHRYARTCLTQLTPDVLRLALEQESIFGINTIQNHLETIYTGYIVNISTE